MYTGLISYHWKLLHHNNKCPLSYLYYKCPILSNLWVEENQATIARRKLLMFNKANNSKFQNAFHRKTVLDPISEEKRVWLSNTAPLVIFFFFFFERLDILVPTYIFFMIKQKLPKFSFWPWITSFIIYQDYQLHHLFFINYVSFQIPFEYFHFHIIHNSSNMFSQDRGRKVEIWK